MKKIFYFALTLSALFAAASCNKESDRIVPEAAATKHTVTINAGFSVETRTAYANDKTFSWVKGDKIWVGLLDAENKYEYDAFEAQESGPAVSFQGEVTDNYALNQYMFAFYPGTAQDPWYEDAYVTGTMVRMPLEYYLDYEGTPTSEYFYQKVSSDNPLEHLPLLGAQKEDGDFEFYSATGVVKVTLTELDDAAACVVLTSADGYLTNYFCVKDDEGVISMNSPMQRESDGTVSTYAGQSIYYYFTPKADKSITLYFPVPVGTLAKGSSISVLDANESVIFTKKFNKDVTVPRNTIVELAPVVGHTEWVSLGKGKFLDSSYYVNDSYIKAKDYAEVEIEQDPNDADHYRVVNPYAAQMALTGVSPSPGAKGPDAYLDLNIYHPGDKIYGVTLTKDGIVDYNEYHTGVINTNYRAEMYLLNHGALRNMNTEDYLYYNRVKKYDAEGVPAIIQLAPCYYMENVGGFTYYAQTDNVVVILFPGQDTNYDTDIVTTYIDIKNPSAASPSAEFAISYFGIDINKATFVVAQSEADARALIAAGKGTVVTQADAAAIATDDEIRIEANLAANAPTGSYRLYYQIAVESSGAEYAFVEDESAFYFFNNDDNLGLADDAPFGTFLSNDPVECRYYVESAGGHDWQDVENFGFVFEASNDDFAGNVMITLFNGYQGQYYLAPDEEIPTTAPVYGDYNPATGEMIFPADQPFFAFTESETDNTVAGYISFRRSPSSDGPLQFKVNADGTISFIGQIYLVSLNAEGVFEQSFYQICGGTFDGETILTKQVEEGGATSAPALSRIPSIRGPYLKADFNASNVVSALPKAVSGVVEGQKAAMATAASDYAEATSRYYRR